MRFLLVHGSCHGAWCWRDVLPVLNTRHQADAIDLPGRANDPRPIETVTLDSHAQAICDSLTAPTILVGHSAGGYAISAAAERDPRNIAGLIYVCAYVPRSGESLAQMRRSGPRQPLAPALRISEDRRTFSFAPSFLTEIFYHDCPPESISFAASRLCPEPILPQETPLELSARSQSLPRAYIRCSEDHAIPPEFQSQMASDLPIENLPTSHSPFFAAPEALAKAIITQAEAF